MVNCGQPSALNNGGNIVVGPTTYLSISVYSCPTGHTLSVANPVRTCTENGNWSGSNPTCDREFSEVQCILLVSYSDRRRYNHVYRFLVTVYRFELVDMFSSFYYCITYSYA